MKGLLTSLLTVLTFTGLQAGNPSGVPKLIVGLTIDQLRTDYVEAFSSLYGERGFKRLWKEGRVYRNAEYNFTNVDKASSVAAIYTGAYPNYNGIVSERWMDKTSLIPINSVDDRAFMGIYTDESTSAEQLLVSTITDELKIATQGKAIVYAIAPYKEAAILSAGHAANGAFWLNDDTGKWCGSTYYDDFPYWLTRYNDQQGVDLRISKMTWTPYLPLDMYRYMMSGWTDNSFKYNFDDYRKNKFRRFKSSPFINHEINSLVTECLYSGRMGEDDIPDFLSLTYYAGNYDGKSTLDGALEIQDVYVRLDNYIGDLLEMIEKKVGLDNTLFFITSTGYTASDAPDLSKYKIPGGEFYMNRCAALLNMYLMALYGEGQYVDTYHGMQIYLNHKLLEQKELSLPEMLSKSADFLIQFSGVNEVYTSYRLLLGAWTPEISKMRNSYHRKRSGDLILDILPGWTIINEDNAGNILVKKTYIPSPLIFMGNQVKPEIIHSPAQIDCIAPTLAHFMRIRAPNASKGQPLTDIRK